MITASQAEETQKSKVVERYSLSLLTALRQSVRQGHTVPRRKGKNEGKNKGSRKKEDNDPWELEECEGSLRCKREWKEGKGWRETIR